MATVDLTAENFATIVDTPGLLLIDFWAAWCGPCLTFAPVYDRAAERHTDVVFGKVDVQAQTGLATAFQITSIPTLMAIRDGVAVYAKAGAPAEQALEDLITKAKATTGKWPRR